MAAQGASRTPTWCICWLFPVVMMLMIRIAVAVLRQAVHHILSFYGVLT